MPFEIKYSHETLLKEKNIDEADLPQSIREAIESFNAVKATLPKKSNQVRSALSTELKLESKKIADTITEWQKDPSQFSTTPVVTEPAPSDTTTTPGDAPPDSSPSPSMEQGGSTTPEPAPQTPPALEPVPVPPVQEPKKKSGSFMKIALWGLFGILAITVGPEMVNNTKEWLKQRKK